MVDLSTETFFIRFVNWNIIYHGVEMEKFSVDKKWLKQLKRFETNWRNMIGARRNRYNRGSWLEHDVRVGKTQRNRYVWTMGGEAAAETVTYVSSRSTPEPI